MALSRLIGQAARVTQCGGGSVSCAGRRSFGLMVGVSCLWCSSAVPGVSGFLRVTQSGAPMTTHVHMHVTFTCMSHKAAWAQAARLRRTLGATLKHVRVYKPRGAVALMSTRHLRHAPGDHVASSLPLRWNSGAIPGSMRLRASSRPRPLLALMPCCTLAT